MTRRTNATGWTDWATLTHAYGSAEDIPDLLAALEESPSTVLWTALWSRLWHQGDTYSASYAALPWFAGYAAACERPVGERDQALIMAGSIFAESAHTEGAGQIRVRHGRPVATLHRVALERTSGPADDYVYLLQALMAFEDVPVWGENLDGLGDGEYEVSCPGCSSDLFIVISEQYGYVATSGDHISGDVARTPLRPTAVKALDPLPRRLHALALNAREETLALGLTHLFGEADCPDCGAAFSVASRVAAARDR